MDNARKAVLAAETSEAIAEGIASDIHNRSHAYRMTVIKADGFTYSTKFIHQPTIEQIQQAVGGYITNIPNWDAYEGEKAFVFANEDADWRTDMPINTQATDEYKKMFPPGAYELRGDVCIVQQLI